MTLAPPDLPTLRAYVEGTLPDDDASSVRAWLIVAGTEDVLEIVEALAAAATHARERESYWVSHPLRARLARLAWRARSTLGDLLHIESGLAAPVGGTLRTAAEHPQRAVAGDPTQVTPDVAVDLVVTPASPVWCAAYAVADDGSLIVLPAAHGARHPAGATVEVGALMLDAGETLEVFVVLDSAGPLPRPPAGSDATWLVELLASPSSTRSVLSATLRAQPNEPAGKQT
ncbi:MAG: hypothetical protein R3B06_05045 [Kofleriaceae bacterium]